MKMNICDKCKVISEINEVNDNTDYIAKIKEEIKKLRELLGNDERKENMSAMKKEEGHTVVSNMKGIKYGLTKNTRYRTLRI